MIKINYVKMFKNNKLSVLVNVVNLSYQNANGFQRFYNVKI